MMRYRIAGNIIFDTENRYISSENEGHVVDLSIPACRLLEFMLKHKDSLLERDDILTEVWDKYGLRGSGNNLNQYISVLRRTLSGMGCEDFFITVPKVGFRVNPGVDIQLIENEHISHDETMANAAPLPSHNPIIKRGTTSPTLFYLLAPVFLLLCVFVYFKRDAWAIRQIEPSHVLQDNACDFIYLNKSSKSEKEKMNAKATAFLKSKGLECSKDDVIIASVVNFDKLEGVARSFMSLCRENYKGNIIDCNSFYIRN